MFEILRHPVFSRLYAAQVVALLGTGLLTIALGLLAYELAGARAGSVLGTALAIKMVAYVVVAPLASAALDRLPRRKVLITADLVRASIALCLPFITEIWQIYVLIFALQAASATFTPAFQATIPTVLPKEADYTRALSLSRLAYELENLLSPVLAGLLLTVMSFNWLFLGTVLGFLLSAQLIARTTLPAKERPSEEPFRTRLTRGTRIYLATPRLRGLLACSVTAASISAFVLVNTVVLVRDSYGGLERDLAIAIAAYGAGAMVSALLLPQLLERVTDRAVMTSAAVILSVLWLALGVALTNGLLPWAGFLLAWAVGGLFYGAITTPGGRLVNRSATQADRTAVFAAQFTLSHAGWLVTYPLAGWVGAVFGLSAAMILLAIIGLLAAITALLVWPSRDPQEMLHIHPDLPKDHPHVKRYGGREHSHTFVIDDLHPVWPRH